MGLDTGGSKVDGEVFGRRGWRLGRGEWGLKRD